LSEVVVALLAGLETVIIEEGVILDLNAATLSDTTGPCSVIEETKRGIDGLAVKKMEGVIGGILVKNLTVIILQRSGLV
jgi:hypothetical protein